MSREEIFRKIIQLLNEEEISPEQIAQSHQKCLVTSETEEDYSECMKRRLSQKELQEEYEL